jgi:SEC-C motif-containing protein
MSSDLCPCTSGKPFASCCGPYLARSSKAKTVKQLMRSRYSAFALGGHGDYLLETWHPGSAGALTAESLSAKTFNWQGLTILDFRHKGDEGMVKFEAQYLDDEGKPELLQEVSRFIRVSGLWLYLDSE